MKKIIYILAMAAVAAVSCQKFEKEAPAVNEAPAFTRTLYACFDGEVKTTLGNDFTPAWETGDTIYLYAGNTQERHIIGDANTSLGDGKVKIETSLTGDVYAIYGATATLSGSTLTFDITDKIGTEFKDAHVCAAKDIDGVLSFKNATSIIRIKKDSKDINYVSISSADPNKAQGEINAEFDNAGDITISSNSYTTNITLGTKGESGVAPFSSFTNCISSDFYYFSVIPGDGYSVILERYGLTGNGKVNKIYQHSIADKTVGENKIITITPKLQQI